MYLILNMNVVMKHLASASSFTEGINKPGIQRESAEAFDIRA